MDFVKTLFFYFRHARLHLFFIFSIKKEKDPAKQMEH